MKRILLIIFVCCSILGCVTMVKSAKLGKNIDELEQMYIQKEAENVKLKQLVEDKDKQIKELEAKNESLRKQLEAFGVFK